MNKNKFAKATLLEPRQLNCFVLTRTTSLLKHRVFKKKVPILVLLRGAIKKKLPNFGHCPNMGEGVSGEARLFFEKRYGQAGTELGQAQLPTGIWFYCEMTRHLVFFHFFSLNRMVQSGFN